MAALFALVASICFAVTHILFRRGLIASNAIAGSIFSLTLSVIILWSVAPFFLSWSSFQSPALWYFTVAGIIAPGLGRTLNFLAMERVGVTRAVSIVNSSPIFASIFAVIVLGEAWPLQNMVGTCLVVLGVVILSISGKKEGQWRKIDIIYPILGALFFGGAANVRKFGLIVDNVPFMAAVVTATAALLCAPAMLQTKVGREVFALPRSSFGWFLAAGFVNTGAMFLSIYALSFGKIVIVEPLLSTSPVLTVVLSAMFLKDLEAVTLRIVIGTACTVLGTIFVVTL